MTNSMETDKQTVVFSKEIPVRYTVDVFVGGGGPAGTAAAIAAGRAGCSVFLAEGAGCLGGMGTAGLVPLYMPHTDGEHELCGGIGREIMQRMHKAGGGRYHHGDSIDAELLKRTSDELVLDAGVTLSLHTHVVDVHAENGTIRDVILWGKSGLFAVRAQVYLDCTGDGDVCVLAGAEYEKGDETGAMMAGTLCSQWEGIRWDGRDDTPQAAYEPPEMLWQGEASPQAVEDGVLSVDDRHLPGIWRTGETSGGGNVGHAFGVDNTDEVSVTQALVEQRRRLTEYETYYRRYVPGFENARLVASADTMGIRESRRIVCDYQLCAEDYRRRAVFLDEIGRFNYPVDRHAATAELADHAAFEEEFYHRYTRGESYGLPYRMLLPRGLTNALVAGKCAGTDKSMQASVRVMACCYIMGQAAGAAAALSVQLDCSPRQIPVDRLQQVLRANGAYLPDNPANG